MTISASPAAQDYLKGIWLLEEESAGEEPITMGAVAERLEVSAASATNMLKKLAAIGLVDHEPYRGARLTDEGRRVALEVVRHHRLLETYLAQTLGVPWEEVHDEAEVLEHALSESLEERIATHLGDPTVDPHGHPIPSRNLEMPSRGDQRLWAQATGRRLTVARVSDADSESLRYLAGIGITPGSAVLVTARGPGAGPLFIEVEGEGHALSKEMAESIWVS